MPEVNSPYRPIFEINHTALVANAEGRGVR